MEEEAGVVVHPAVLRLNQRDGRFVPVFGLAADDAYGLVHQNRDLVGLGTLGLLRDLDACIGRNLHAHLGHLAINLDPALGDPVVRFAPGGQA